MNSSIDTMTPFARPLHHRALLAAALVLALSGCREKAAPTPAPTQAPTSGVATADARQQAIASLMALPELKAWSSAIEKSSGGSARGAVIEYDAAPRLIDGKRYYQLSFVENGKDAVHRWEDFLVAEEGGTILVEDGAGDKPLSLAQWRSNKRPLERTH
ncbi:hypothetical protein [Massilia sp. DWR3-1-1]|uniref:hypothetical protein n=1 Tax=Massilia sp. DWR3-1-1 TaxID=2804559 RepID=UPI003CF9068B